MLNPFFINKGPFKTSKILSLLGINSNMVNDDIDITNEILKIVDDKISNLKIN